MGVNDTIYQHELITRRVSIAYATDPNQIGISGIVTDESRQTLTILPEDGSAPRMVPKAKTGFHFINEDIIIDGSQIVFRPEDRIKRLAPRYRKKRASKVKDNKN